MKFGCDFCKWDKEVENDSTITYSHGQELFYKFVSDFTNKLVKQLCT